MSRSSPKTKSDRKAKPHGIEAQPAAPFAHPNWWKYALAIVAAVFVAFEAYGPAMNGAFLFDDRFLPFLRPGAEALTFSGWIGNTRPLLMFSYWANFKIGGTEPYGYHFVNLLLHVLNSAFVFLIVRRLLDGTEITRRILYASFAGLLFLLHPLQTESVAYVASRSETLSVVFAYAALTVFLCRREITTTIPVAAAVLSLFGAAVFTKEHAAILPLVFLLADYFFNPREGSFSLEGIRKNWKLYLPLGLGGIAGIAYVGRVVFSSNTTGFRMKDLTWSDYLFTQGRVLWTYLRLFVLPAGLNADYDIPISHSPFDHGAIFGLIAFAGLLTGAWVLRRKYPLAAFGIFAFAILIAPTSSIVPIRDPIAERRMYLPFLGLTLVVVELLRRLKMETGALIATLGGILAICAVGTYRRAEVWSSPLTFWTDATEKSPAKARPHFQLAYAQYESGRCDLASEEYGRTAKLQPISYELALDWAIALDCANRAQEAIQKLDQAAALERSAHPHAEKARILMKLARSQEAFAALAVAEGIDPTFEYIYVYRGGLFESRGDYASAAGQFTKALAINPNNTLARDGLARANYGIGARR